MALLYWADKKVSAIAAIIRDDTRRFEKDRAQRKRINELQSQLAGSATATVDAPPSEQSVGCPVQKTG